MRYSVRVGDALILNIGDLNSFLMIMKLTNVVALGLLTYGCTAFATTSVSPIRYCSALNMGLFQQVPKVVAPKAFSPPEPRPLTLTDPSYIPNIIRGSLALSFRLGTGIFVLGWTVDSFFADEDDTRYSLKIGPFNIRDSSTVLHEAPRPKRPLILYEYEASPFCKKVRETINLLDLTVEYKPCPGARQGFSDDLFRMTGRRTVPFLIDPNTQVSMFQSADQIQYLLDTYGPTDKSKYDLKALWPITFERFALITSVLAAQIRQFAGSARQVNARPDNEKMKSLELWGYECSPFVKPVREKLCELCLPHTYISCSRGSANRDRMVKKMGRFQVPFLVDPNTGVEMYEAFEIVKYLDAVYTTTSYDPVAT